MLPPRPENRPPGCDWETEAVGLPKRPPPVVVVLPPTPNPENIFCTFCPCCVFEEPPTLLNNPRLPSEPPVVVTDVLVFVGAIEDVV
jgi:hypothetical protein